MHLTPLSNIRFTHVYQNRKKALNHHWEHYTRGDCRKIYRRCICLILVGLYNPGTHFYMDLTGRNPFQVWRGEFFPLYISAYHIHQTRSEHSYPNFGRNDENILLKCSDRAAMSCSPNCSRTKIRLRRVKEDSSYCVIENSCSCVPALCSLRIFSQSKAAATAACGQPTAVSDAPISWMGASQSSVFHVNRPSFLYLFTLRNVVSPIAHTTLHRCGVCSRLELRNTIIFCGR